MTDVKDGRAIRKRRDANERSLVADERALRRRAKIVHEKLLATYGEPQWTRLDGVSELVATILSQNTNDGNRDLAYARLRARFPTWEAVRDAPVEAVIEAIRPAGLANQKGPRIQLALRHITEARGKLDIDFLAQMPVDEARRWLLDIKGIGPKTAAIVLLFCYDKPVFPVDTHVHRVTGRLGLRPPQLTADQTHEWMERICPPGAQFAFHINLIRHGRAVCHARNPECTRCPLRRWCDYFRRHIQTRGSAHCHGLRKAAEANSSAQKSR